MRIGDMFSGRASGGIDSFDTLVVRGWAYDPRAASGETEAHILLGEISLPVTPDIVREDVREAGGAPIAEVGFALDLGQLDDDTAARLRPVFDGGAHEISLIVNGRQVAQRKEVLPRAFPGRNRFGSIDAVTAFGISGWCFSHDGVWRDGAELQIDDAFAVPLTHTVERPDVAQMHGGDSLVTGFAISFAALPAGTKAAIDRLFDGKVHRVELLIGGFRVVSLEQVLAPSFSVSAEGRGQGTIAGWVACSEDPPPVRAAVGIDGHVVESRHLVNIDRDRAAREAMKWGAHFATRLACGIDPDTARAQVTVAVEGTAGQPVASLEIDMPRRADRRAEIAFARAAQASRPQVSVIVPIYNAADALAECLDSFARHLPDEARLILIDDASTDETVSALLDTWRERDNVSILQNETNIGYTATVNRAIAAAGDDDVVLLNSDTRVTPRWLANLALAAYSAPDIASVTAVSDNAGAFSVPEEGTNDWPRDFDDDEIARLVTRSSGLLWPETPTGSGFCCFIRRAALTAVGGFDEAAFPRGYGEENDWAMRAGEAGWRHLVDERTLVFHRRNASFGAEREGLLAASREILKERYPDYPARVTAFTRSQALGLSRARIASALEKAAASGPKPRARLMFVISTTDGGTPMTNADLMAALQGRFETMLLQCDARTLTLSRVEGREQHEVERHVLSEPISPASHRSAEYDAVVAEWLVAHAIELVHVRHIAWHSLGLVSAAKDLSVPVVFSFHDYYTACPSLKLLDENLVFCGGRCTPTREGDCRADLWQGSELPPLKGEWVLPWRRSQARMLAQCDAYVTTSSSARDVVAANFPQIDREAIAVIPHGRDFAALRTPAASPAATSDGYPLRILLPGTLTGEKGAALVRDIMVLDRQGLLEMHILGDDGGTLAGIEGIVRHGAYRREDFLGHLEAIAPDLGAVLSLWPETFCHTLTELWAAGLPVLGLDIGAVGERLRETGGGWVVPIGEGPGTGEEPLAERVYATLRALQANRAGITQAAGQVALAQQALGERTTGWMAEQYVVLYSRLLNAGRDRLWCAFNAATNRE